MTPRQATEIDEFLAALAMRLVAGARDYGDASFGRAIADTVREIDQECVDTVGWLFVLWAQLARHGGSQMRGAQERGAWLDNLGRRLRDGDREEFPLGHLSLGRARSMVEVLAVDAFEWRQAARARLDVIVAQIEIERQIELDRQYRARRGSTRDPRSDD